MRRVLVTGGSGFLGSNLVDRYLADPSVRVVSYDRSPPRAPAHAPVWVPGDLLDGDRLREVMTDLAPTHLVHLAAVTDQGGRTMQDYAANTDGVRTVLACAGEQTSLQRSLFASSRLVCEMGELPTSDYDYFPPNLYGRSKVVGEQLVRADRTLREWVLVRPTSIWGPWGEAPYRDFFLSLARGTYVHPGHERVRKSYGYVGNTVHQVDGLLTAPAERVHGRTFYLADPEPVEVGAFAAAARAAMGLPPPRSVPVALLHVLARTADALAAVGVRRLPISADRLRHLRADMLYDVGPVTEVVGPVPFTAHEGIEAYVAHLRAQGDIP